MVLDNWGTVDRWIAVRPRRQQEEGGIGALSVYCIDLPDEVAGDPNCFLAQILSLPIARASTDASLNPAAEQRWFHRQRFATSAQ
jgi:hypothetical protein